MRDGRTRNLRESRGHVSFEQFKQEFGAELIIVEGDLAGTQVSIEHSPIVIGRAADADFTIDHDSLSRQHAVVEYAGGGYRVRDLGSTNGVSVGGRRVDASDLEPGDRFSLGEVVFQVLIEVREPEPFTYELIVD